MSLVKFSNSAHPSRYNPYHNEDVFNDLFNWNNRQVMNSRSNSPSVNIKENEDGFALELATPGLKKEDFKIELNNDILTISAEKKEEESKDKFSKHEFSPLSFERAFTLPDTVSGDKIKANYENGILTLSIPK
ncbi:MAG: Hsp20/alpha crystallin family protein [Bacteroidales bacterium]|jgi:HSP20 family protein|nr:Hsp20/alpha crystallin family protein [Bacteroidales bacterium]